MLTSAQKHKTSSESAQLFPSVVTSTEASLNYMKRLTAVAVSNILYLRNVFTEDCYGHRKLDHLKLRILTERCEALGAKRIVQWIKGCFDAMEKQYLRQMTLGVYCDPSNPDELIEAYTFRFTYTSNQFNCNISLNKNKTERVISEQSGSEELLQSTVQLLRSLIIMVQSLDKLPEDCYLTMKLLYYDDITPEDYEPPGFVPSDKDFFTFKGKPISINAGEVITPFHALKVKIRTNQQQFEDFGPTPDSSPHIRSQELLDDCTPLPIEEPNCEDKQPKRKTEVSIMSTSSHSLINDINNSQKMKEKTVISKIKEMRVEDNENPMEVQTSAHQSSKRKSDFEVTQDSIFSSLPNKDKRFKASTNKGVSIKKKK